MKKFLCIFVFLIIFFSNISVYAIDFRVGNDSFAYSNLIYIIRRGFSEGNNAMRFSIISDEGNSITIDMRLSIPDRDRSVYITHINGEEIEPNYRSDIDEISLNDINRSINDAAQIFGRRRGDLTRKREIIKILAYMIAEAARFRNISNEFYNLFSGSAASIRLYSFGDEVNCWGHICRYIVNHYRQPDATTNGTGLFVDIPAQYYTAYVNSEL